PQPPDETHSSHYDPYFFLQDFRLKDYVLLEVQNQGLLTDIQLNSNDELNIPEFHTSANLSDLLFNASGVCRAQDDGHDGW
ncbi:unnamed protein product, partial [Larinioides sclopetarius]